MKNIILVLFSFFFLSIFLTSAAQKATAAQCTFDFNPKNLNPSQVAFITVTANNTLPGKEYSAEIGTAPTYFEGDLVSGGSGTITLTVEVIAPENGDDMSVSILTYEGGIPQTRDDCIPVGTNTVTVGSSGDGDGGAGQSGTNPCPGGNCTTAIGTFSSDPQAFVDQVLTIAVGLAGGIAFILMVIGAIRVLTSTGNPQNVNAGRDMIVAALAGLLFLIFSVLILKFIGVEIIGLSG